MTTQGKGEVAHHLVVSLNVTGGFLAGVQLDFADGLNCLIGGRGAGKTTALEFLRFGLGLMPDLKANPQRYRAIEALVKANLGNGQLTIELRTKTNMRYTAGRSAHESVQVLNEAGTAVPISLDRDQIFGADVFSQNEIEEIASSPAAQLELLDRFQEREAVAIDRELEQLQHQLDQSSLDLRRIDEEVDDARGRASELPVVLEKLKGIAEAAGPDASRINVAHAAKSLRAREEKVPGLIIAALQKLVREIRSNQSAFQAGVDAQLDIQVRQGANRELFQALQDDIENFARRLAVTLESIENQARVVEERIRTHETVLAERHAVQEAEYRTIIAASEEQGERAAERLALQTALANCQSAANEQLAKEQQRQGMTRIRSDLLKRASELRDQRFALRKRIAERLSSQFPSIRVTVNQAGELHDYQEVVTDALKGSGVKQGVAAERLCQVFLPTELAHVVANNDLDALMQRSGFDEERSKKILSTLRSGGTHYTIETVALDDRPCIELLDGDTFKESTRLSTGQRCTTILPILLAQSERPLLIDQPEDNLDNAFVYETIVRALRTIKGSRQVIFVTHNPNIPVLGEAERVFVFSSDGQHSTLKQVGTVDECREHIERILEGGREAFLLRKARYGH
ncbi:MAG TPA: AAA family ATPase [Terriglobales bacterium]|nr:AAA family ATPase [Terriglobales bacterium]